MLKKITVVIMAVIMMGVIAINGMYLAHKHDEFKTDEEFVMTMFSYGIGTGVPQTCEGSVYGKHYIATYKFDKELCEVHRTVEWQ